MLKRTRWMKIVAVLVVVVGFAVGSFAFGPGVVCHDMPDPGICTRQPAAQYRLWTIALSAMAGMALWFVDALRNVDADA